MARRPVPRTSARLRKRVYAHLLELPALFFTRHKAGDLSSRVGNDVDEIQSVLTTGLVGLVRAVLTLVAALVIMAGLNLRLTLLVAVLIPSTILMVRFFRVRKRSTVQAASGA